MALILAAGKGNQAFADYLGRIEVDLFLERSCGEYWGERNTKQDLAVLWYIISPHEIIQGVHETLYMGEALIRNDKVRHLFVKEFGGPCVESVSDEVNEERRQTAEIIATNVESLVKEYQRRYN